MRFSLFSSLCVTLTLNDLTAFSSCGFCSGLLHGHLRCRLGFISQASSLAATSRVSWSAAMVSTGQCWSVRVGLNVAVTPSVVDSGDKWPQWTRGSAQFCR